MSESANAALLARYHSCPGRTVAMLAPFRDARGRSSYDLLAAEVRDLPEEAGILDLACGDGYLMSLLAGRGGRRLVGIDRSAEELAAARTRLGARVELYCCDASALPFPAGAVDAVVCHMALMLMDALDAVLAEAARVLKPGGLLVAVINRGHHDPAFAVYSRELRRITGEAGLARLQLGPPDVFTAEGLRARLRSPLFDEQHLQIHDFVVQLQTPPSGLWPLLASAYDVFRLPEAAQEALARSLFDAWGKLADASGQLTAAMGMRLIKCRTRTAALTS